LHIWPEQVRASLLRLPADNTQRHRKYPHHFRWRLELHTICGSS
jgi:hypothetical protein